VTASRLLYSTKSYIISTYTHTVQYLDNLFERSFKFWCASAIADVTTYFVAATRRWTKRRSFACSTLGIRRNLRTLHQNPCYLGERHRSSWIAVCFYVILITRTKAFRPAFRPTVLQFVVLVLLVRYTVRMSEDNRSTGGTNHIENSTSICLRRIVPHAIAHTIHSTTRTRKP
jgi:hypothetical protein